MWMSRENASWWVGSVAAADSSMASLSLALFVICVVVGCFAHLKKRIFILCPLRIFVLSVDHDFHHDHVRICRFHSKIFAARRCDEDARLLHD